MQHLLTIAFNAVAIASIAYVLLAFTGFIMSRRCKVSPGQLELPLFDEPSPVNPAEPIAEPLSDCVVPFKRPQARFQWSELSPYDLRRQCAAKGIKWRNVHGKNKHLKKSEMVTALEAIAS